MRVFFLCPFPTFAVAVICRAFSQSDISVLLKCSAFYNQRIFECPSTNKKIAHHCFALDIFAVEDNIKYNSLVTISRTPFDYTERIIFQI